MLLVRFSVSVALVGFLCSMGYGSSPRLARHRLIRKNSEQTTKRERDGLKSELPVHSSLNSKPGGKEKIEKINGLRETDYTANKNTTGAGRQYSGGWGWPSQSSGNLDFYGLLGGLGFLGLLLAQVLYFTNRTATTRVTIVNAGRRRRALQGLEDEDEIMGETVADLLEKLGSTFNLPWWDREESLDKKQVVPFKLI